MRLKFGSVLFVFCVVALAAAGPARAALLTVSEAAAAQDVHVSDEVIVTGPFSFKTFIDRLSVSSGPVTLSGGDTLAFHLALVPPTRFAIGTTADVYSVGVTLESSAAASPPAVTGNEPTTVLLAPEHEPPSGPHFSAYTVDASGRVALLSVVQEFGSLPPGAAGTVTVAADVPTKNTFSGFDGSVVLPPDFPTTTFDRSVSLFVTGEVHRASDPPPPLAFLTTVPEPTAAGALATCASAAGLRRGARRRGRDPLSSKNNVNHGGTEARRRVFDS